MGIKYKMEFVNAQNINCVVNFIVDDDVYSEDPIILYGGPRPFVLSEFNQDSDIFKPIRPQQATIEVLASGAGAELMDFIIEDDDRQMQVRFDFGTFIGYWYGILSQEDMSEIWIQQNHLLTLRADEGFGVMKTIPLTDFNGNILTGTYTPFQLIQYASTETVRTFLRTNIISNLFHTSMSSASKQTGLDQCKIDVRTFEESPGQFDDSYTVLDKINKAFNQTIYQYNGEWWIVRQEEMFIPKATNIIGFTTNRPTLGQRANINTKYMANVGIREKIKPIMPEMIKTINKPSNKTIIKWDWENYDQVICNESFKYGSFVETTGTEPNQTDKYTVTDWTLQYGLFVTPTGSNKLLQRHVVFANNTLSDEYLIIEREDTNVFTWARSCKMYVVADSLMNLAFQHTLKQNVPFGGFQDVVMVVLLYGDDGTYWTLDDSGGWFQSNSSFTSNLKLLQASYASSTGADWFDKEVESTIPRKGYIELLIANNGLDYQYRYYRNLTVGIEAPIQKFRRQQIAGDADSYTLNKSYKNNYEETIFISDSNSPNYKGTILQNDGITITSGEWYRRRYSTERFSTKRHNAIANWFINSRYRVRLDCNLYGLMYEKDGSEYPIGLVNTVNFVDDAPNKTFAIVNMKEIDFMNCTWSAELLEIWDEFIDDDVVPDESDVYSNDLYYK